MWHIIDILLVVILVGGAGVLLIKRAKNTFSSQDSHCVGCSNHQCPYRDKDIKH